MRKFFYPSSVAVFGVSDQPMNLGKNIIFNCLELGFKGEIFPMGRTPGQVYGQEIITDPASLPEGIDLAVILVPAPMTAQTLDICGKKGIRRAVISSGGFREYDEYGHQAERELLAAAARNKARFIGPNCLGVICTNSGLCTAFGPLQPGSYKQGSASLIAQSGGVTTQSSYSFSEEHVGFSKIISAGNKLDLNEVDFIEYLIEDEDTDQVHMYLESIDDGRGLTGLARRSEKPIIIYKSNVSRTASPIAYSHTAALSNDDRVVEGAMRQAGIIRVQSIHDMTVCAKALRLLPLKGNRLVAISMSGGFSVILGDACEKYGFECPPLPRSLLDEIESHRRGGVIRMSNPMDLGDVHKAQGFVFIIESCLSLDFIDGLVLSMIYDPGMGRMFGRQDRGHRPMLSFIKRMSEKSGKPIALSFFSQRHFIEEFKADGQFPVFNDPVESVLALRMLRDYWQVRHGQERAE